MSIPSPCSPDPVASHLPAPPPHFPGSSGTKSRPTYQTDRSTAWSTEKFITQGDILQGLGDSRSRPRIEFFDATQGSRREIWFQSVLKKSPISMMLVCGVNAVVPAAAESAVRRTLDFSVTADVGFGKEVCVSGAHPLLGGGNPLGAPKLTWTPGNLWRGKIALEAGTTFTYQFISRDFATGVWPNATNSILIGSSLTATSPAHVAPPWSGKCIGLDHIRSTCRP